MEIKEFELEIANGQMSFDFEEEEMGTIPAEKLIKSQNFTWIGEETLFVVVRTQNKALSNDLPSLKLCGKKMIDWVRLAGSSCQQIVVDDGEDVFERIKDFQTDKKYIAIFYSDTPLLSKNLFYKIMNYFSSKNINYLKLARGYVAKAEFINSCPNLMQNSAVGFEDEGLSVADNAKTISQMNEILQHRILAFHQANGVIIYGKNTIFIDADAEIEAGVVIYPNNIIKGESIISSGTILESGNVIKNSIISSNCQIENSYIEKSKISQGKTIKAFSKIIEEEV